MNDRAVFHPLLAGVCSRLAQLFHCNAWVLRAGFVLMLVLKTLLAMFLYLVLALLFRLLDRYRSSGHVSDETFSLDSPQFSSRSRRIEELDRRFREWENSSKS